MKRSIPRPFGQNYAFVAAGAVFIALMATAGLRATPGVLMLPLERAFGWIACGHQAGAAVAAITAGILRASQGRYLEAFVLAGVAAVIAAFASLMIRRGATSAAA